MNGLTWFLIGLGAVIVLLAVLASRGNRRNYTGLSGTDRAYIDNPEGTAMRTPMIGGGGGGGGDGGGN